jgi:hypothetical protein
VKVPLYSALLAAAWTAFPGLWFGREVPLLDRLQFWLVAPGFYITLFASHASIHSLDFRIAEGVNFILFFPYVYVFVWTSTPQPKDLTPKC